DVADDDEEEDGQQEEAQADEDEEEGGRGDSEDAAKDEAEDAEESGAHKPTDGVDSAMNLDGNDDADPNTAAESNDALSKPSETSDSNRQQQPASSAMQQEAFMQQQDDSQNPQQQQQPDEQQERRNLNPERTLADVIEKWERRLNIVMREKEEESQQQQPEDAKPSEEQNQHDPAADKQKQEDGQAAPGSTDFEHVKQDEDFDKVALADADEHDKEQQQQHQPMDIDDELEDGGDDGKGDDAEDSQDAEMNGGDDDQAAGASAAARPAMMQAAPQQLPATHADGESAAEAAQMQQSGADADQEEAGDEAMDTDEQQAAEDQQPAVDVDRLRAELEQLTADWRANKQGSEQAVELWQSYTRLTHDLSLMLTEQLRLILTPTQATQLRGDYRTGKRLNMKRIIPYIASEFRKDKIWLRRTKPARREYQVMVAVDNSKSMAQNTQAVELAYETLALVTTALNQLEVGQLSVVSFGEQVSLLHPFDSAFDSEAGARVLSRFTFADDKTDVVQLMDASLQLFEQAAHGASSAASDLWRLQLVISDGVCQDHPRLLHQVRAAMEMRVMTVFIVLDRSAIATAAAAEGLDPEKDSIMNTQHVSFVKGPSGKMEMKVQRYLDTFPFKYYVVLRNIHGLPAVLAETLRQYFSLIGSD
ncbi:hypothetical protein LPJ75_004461, partial [Coemansia sp. RSA 2598]